MASKKKSASSHIEVLSDQEIVLSHCNFAQCGPIKNGFHIFITSVNDGRVIPLHSGIAKTESDAWKMAARLCL